MAGALGRAGGWRPSRFSVGVAIAFGISLLLLDDPDLLRVPVLAATPSDVSVFRIVSPAEGEGIGEGNLVVVEAEAVDPTDGVVDRVQFSFDASGAWVPGERDPEDSTHWRYLWDGGEPGLHEIQARAFGMGGSALNEQRVAFRLADPSSAPFALEHPYANPGRFWKGQLHAHSTSSFDGWASLRPADLAIEYRRQGFSFLAITDHDVISYPREVIDPSFLALPAYESTSESGHITGLFTESVVPDGLPAQQRIDHIRNGGGMAVLNHPSWSVGWTGTDFRTLQGCFAFEMFNGVTDNPDRRAHNVALWHEVLNAKGRTGRIWAVATDDAHNPEAIGRGWIMLKATSLSEAAVRRSLEAGDFYASSGPSFSALGVMRGAMTASSPDASTIRFIDQDNRVVSEGPAKWATYLPTGKERWIRDEAVAADDSRAWSQPFWLVAGSGADGPLPPQSGAAGG